MDIKPIETYYNGYRFRSRLEARWAVFFDEVGIEYEYEMEGYTFNKNVYYLPDFYLPSLKTFVEIKPHGSCEIAFKDGKYVPTFSDVDEKKILSAMHEMPNGKTCFLIVCGDPYDAFPHMTGTNDMAHGEAYIFYDTTTKNSKKRISAGSVMFASEYKDGFAWEIAESVVKTNARIHNAGEALFSKMIFGENASFADWEDWTKAGIKARQARFEYGETPNASKVTLFDYDKIPF